jgi:hypothetical protein
LSEDLTKISAWRGLIEDGKEEAKLKEIADTELPCIINSAKGRTKVEKRRIDAAQKQVASVLAKFVERHGRYRAESKGEAVEELKQKLIDTKPLWGTYECSTWQKKGKQKS